MDIYEQIVELRRQGRRGAVATSVGVTRQPESASPDRPAGAPTGGRNPVGGCSSPSTYCPVFISARKIRTRYPVYNTVVLGRFIDGGFQRARSQPSKNGLLTQPLRSGALKLRAMQSPSQGISPARGSPRLRVSKVCSAAHPSPPINGLPRSAWRSEVPRRR